MEVELHQLTLRYEHLRKRQPLQERALLSSLAELGQQLPIIVVGDTERWVLIDGYKRVRALKRLGRDTARVTRWEVERRMAGALPPTWPEFTAWPFSTSRRPGPQRPQSPATP